MARPRETTPLKELVTAPEYSVKKKNKRSF